MMTADTKKSTKTTEEEITKEPEMRRCGACKKMVAAEEIRLITCNQTNRPVDKPNTIFRLTASVPLCKLCAHLYAR